MRPDEARLHLNGRLTILQGRPEVGYPPSLQIGGCPATVQVSAPWGQVDRLHDSWFVPSQARPECQTATVQESTPKRQKCPEPESHLMVG
jgi:hypothetical protein